MENPHRPIADSLYMAIFGDKIATTVDNIKFFVCRDIPDALPPVISVELCLWI